MSRPPRPTTAPPRSWRAKARPAALAAVLAGALLPGAPRAEDEVVIDIIGGMEAATPIAVVPFQTAGGASPETRIAPIIAADLARSGRFEVLPEADLIATPGRIEDVQFSTWRALGVDYLVVGGLRPGEEQDYRARFELLDAFRGERTDGRSYRVGEGSLRRLAHTLSDRIYKAITGDEGAFSSRIAYIAVSQQKADGGGSGEPAEQRYRLVVADADGHRGRTVLRASAPLLSPAWSPSRDRLAYVSFEGGGSQVFVQELATGERRRVASFKGINSAPAWSPDGERLAVTLSRDGAANIYLIDLDSGETRAITNHWAIDTEAAWAPDGETIYFTSDRGGKPQIYRTGVDGGEVERVTYEGAYNAHPTLSPSGERLAMVHRREGAYHIAVQDLERDAFRVLSDGPADESPSFAPNGDWVLYSAGGDGNAYLETASLIGDAVTPLEATQRPEAQVREPAW